MIPFDRSEISIAAAALVFVLALAWVGVMTPQTPLVPVVAGLDRPFPTEPPPSAPPVERPVSAR